MYSMTGYSFVEKKIEGLSLSVEIKSYNSRFQDLSINLPSQFSRFENDIRKIILSSLSRGKIDVYIRIKDENPEVSISINEAIAEAYAKNFAALEKKLKQKKANYLSFILSQEGVLTSEKSIDYDKVFSLCENAVNEAIEICLIDKKREGENLQKEIRTQTVILKESLVVFKNHQDTMQEQFSKSIQEKYTELTEKVLDDERLMTELALLLIKYTIKEEIARLESHIEILEKEILENSQPGKKIDFICQEIQREVNTIGSKNQIIEVTHAVVSAKEALENIREQAKNVE
ncbi:MAG TPA: YicC/YloC family endoribonuclease [Treponemataceae bacterium]|nr:YicC/YloC family endoribonuclease [Treponemataceae bacterium]